MKRSLKRFLVALLNVCSEARAPSANKQSNKQGSLKRELDETASKLVPLSYRAREALLLQRSANPPALPYAGGQRSGPLPASLGEESAPARRQIALRREETFTPEVPPSLRWKGYNLFIMEHLSVAPATLASPVEMLRSAIAERTR